MQPHRAPQHQQWLDEDLKTPASLVNLQGLDVDMQELAVHKPGDILNAQHHQLHHTLHGAQPKHYHESVVQPVLASSQTPLNVGV
jgi:hypothetical protein